MVTPIMIIPVMLLACFPYFFPIYYVIPPLFVYAMFISKTNHTPTKSNSTTTRRLYTVKTETRRSYDYERFCTLSVSQLFIKHNFAPITTNLSDELFNKALNLGFVVRVMDNYYSLYKHSFSRAVCFSNDFAHVWIEELTIINYSEHTSRIRIPRVACYGYPERQWKQNFVNNVITNTLPLDKFCNYDVIGYRENEHLISQGLYHVILNFPYATTVSNRDFTPCKIDSDTHCLSFIDQIMGISAISPEFDPNCYDNMLSFFRHYIPTNNISLSFYDGKKYTFLCTSPTAYASILFERTEGTQGHVSLIFFEHYLAGCENTFSIPWMHLDGRPKRKVAGRLGPAGFNARQAAYGALEDTAIAAQQIEDQIDAINLQAELVEAQNNLNKLTAAPIVNQPITAYNYTCPNFRYAALRADGRILLLVPFLLSTLIRFFLPFIYWHTDLDSLIFRLLTFILVIITFTLCTAFHYHNHYTTLHITSPRLHLTNVDYLHLLTFDMIFGFPGMLFVIIKQAFQIHSFVAKSFIMTACLILFSLETFIDYQVSFVFFRLFALALYVLVFLMETDSKLSLGVIPTGTTVDVDTEVDLRPDVFQINKFKYQRRIQQVRIDCYTSKYLIYTHNTKFEMIDLELFAQMMNASFDRYDNTLSDIKERMVRFAATNTTINRRRDLNDRYPIIDQSTISFALHYIKYCRSKSSLGKLATQSLNL